MITSFSFAFTNDGRLKMRIAGKLTGCAARKGLDLLRSAAESGRRKINLDLRETTSVDSLGIAMFNWIRSQNGNLSVDILPPIKGVSEDELACIEQAVSSENKSNHTAFYRRERA
ncbi:MAG: hypothetical protein E3J72_08565 [Planctomycetota bacterium]|nr:MAG: hypothetical protein E3J72_08565 [Planctomycetota bacterium]